MWPPTRWTMLSTHRWPEGRSAQMSKQDEKFSLDAIVTEALPNTMFKVRLPDEKQTEVLAYLSGKKASDPISI